MQKILFLLAIFFCSNTHQGHACDQTRLVKADKYDQGATDQLRDIMFNKLRRNTWKDYCSEIKSLLLSRADPDTRFKSKNRLLCVAVQQDEPSLVGVCLQQGGCAHKLPGDYSAPLLVVRSPEVAQLLLDNKASIDHSEYGDNALHRAINLKSPIEVLAFLSNAGIYRYAKDMSGGSYLHCLCLEQQQRPSPLKDFLERIALVSFLQKKIQLNDNAGQTPMDRLKSHSRQLVDPVEEVISVTQTFKRQLQLEQEQVGPLVSAHILPTLTPFVMGYAGLDKVRWEKEHWPIIQSQLTPATTALLEKQKGYGV